MRKIITIASVVIMSACAFAASPAATHDWVRNYVASNITGGATAPKYSQTVDSQGNVTIVGQQYDGGKVTIKGQVNDKLAIVLSNCTAAAQNGGYTNGMKFAWNGNGFFLNGPANLSILATSTNIVCNGIASVVTNGVDYVPGMFRVYGTRITLAECTKLLTPRVTLLDALRGLLIESAKADTWQDLGESWFTPAARVPSDEFRWTVQDNEGNTAEIKIQRDADGNEYISNAEEVINSLKVNVKTLFRNVAELAAHCADMSVELDKVDMQFRTMSENLDGVMRDIYAALDAIKLNEDEYHRKPSDDGTIEYVGPVAMKPDGVSLVMTDKDTGESEINGWKTQAAAGQTLTDYINGTVQNPADWSSCSVLVRDSSYSYPFFVNIGSVGARAVNMTSFDNQSMTTNAAMGAVANGQASLYMFSTAKNAAKGKPWIPYTLGSSLGWHGLDWFADGDTLTTDSNGKITVKGYSSGVGNKHYFGTGVQNDVGFHELPNVTTNYVSGDEKTITSNIVLGEKKLALVGFGQTDASTGPKFAAKVSGYDSLVWIAPPSGENVVGDDVSIEKYFDASSNNTFRVKGFDNGGLGSCDQNLGTMMTDSDSTERAKHKILAWHSSGSLHYVDIGQVDVPKHAVTFDALDGKKFANDGMGVTANFAPPYNWAGVGISAQSDNGGSVRYQLEGIAEAENGTVPTVNVIGASRSIEWKIPESKGKLAVTGTDGVRVEGTNLVFASASDSNVKVNATSADGIITVTIGVYYK